MSIHDLAPVLTVYVVWHPSSEQGALLADLLYRELCGDPAFPAKRGIGIPVRFRTTLSAQDVPAGIPFDTTGHTAVFVLADDELVAAEAWRQYVTELTGGAEANDLVVPVALTVLPRQVVDGHAAHRRLP